MQFDKTSFPVNTIYLNNTMVLIWLDKDERAKGKNVMISEESTRNSENKVLVREVVVEKTSDGRE